MMLNIYSGNVCDQYFHVWWVYSALIPTLHTNIPYLSCILDSGLHVAVGCYSQLYMTEWYSDLQIAQRERLPLLLCQKALWWPSARLAVPRFTLLMLKASREGGITRSSIQSMSRI